MPETDADTPQSTAQNYEPPIPEAVRRQARRAEELQQELFGGGDDASSASGDDGTPVPGSLGDSPPGPAAPSPSPEDWEQRYRTLQGKYDTELPQLRGQVQGLERVLAAMQSAPPAPAPATARPEIHPPPFNPEVLDEDIDTYGPEMVNASRRWAMAEVAPRLQVMQDEIERLKGRSERVETVAQANRVDALLDDDPELRGRWRVINDDPAFLQWLQATDEYAGVTKHQMLSNAYAGGDAVRTGRFFKAFIREQTAASPHPGTNGHTPPPAPAPNGHAGNGTAAMRLEDFAAPGRSAGTPGQGGAPDRRIWTNREIATFYRDRTLGRWRGREAESERLETDILAAAAEGRVRN
jgi:hypothetical protein